MDILTDFPKLWVLKVEEWDGTIVWLLFVSWVVKPLRNATCVVTMKGVNT